MLSNKISTLANNTTTKEDKKVLGIIIDIQNLNPITMFRNQLSFWNQDVSMISSYKTRNADRFYQS